ncbi:MAG TPA: hypothetical protein VGN59_00620 [Acidimicrobiia bacterium]|jgi:hypothetical protein
MLATERTRPSRRGVIVVVAIAVIAFVAAIAIQRNIFPFYSGDHDEPVYRFQAEMLRLGHINIPLAQNQFFRPWLSGPAHGHLVMAFQPGWPSLLMVAQVLTGSMLVALGVAAALTASAAFAFARELLGSTRQAVLAAALVALSPFTLMLSGTYLNYVYALGLYLVFAALLMHALRAESPRPLLLALSGLALGAAFLTRPYDAVLFAVPFAGYIVATRRHDLPAMARIAGWVALGVVPALAITFAYNLATTGALTRFPVSAQSDGYSTFGWGVRSIAPDTPPLNFNVGEAFSSMGTNLWALPTWIFGTYLTCGLAIYGAVKLWRTHRAICGLLIGLAAVFPVGYLVWWASSLTTSGARSGLGPHYYLPVLVPVAVLAAHGIGELAASRRNVLVGALVIGVVLTGIALPAKIDEKHIVEDVSRAYDGQVQRGLRQRDGKPALVIEERRPASYIMEPYPFLANPPDLKSDVLYARDRGPLDIDLIEQHPDRKPYRLVREVQPGGNIEKIPVVVKAQSVLRAPELAIHAAIVNTSGLRTVTAYARFGRTVQRRLLETSATKNERFEVTWKVGPHGLTYAGPPARRIRPVKLRNDKVPGQLVVGATFANTPAPKDPGSVERRYYLRVRRGPARGVELLTADEEWTRFGPPLRAWIPIANGPALQVRFSR